MVCHTSHRSQNDSLPACLSRRPLVAMKFMPRPASPVQAFLGVSFGAPGVELTINDPLRQKLEVLGKVADINIDAEIERQRRDLAADVGMVKMIPHLFVGVSYRY